VPVPDGTETPGAGER